MSAKLFLLNFKFKDKDTGKVINDVKYKLTDKKGNSKEFSLADYPKIWRGAGTYKISVSLDGYKEFKKDYVIEYRPENPVTWANVGMEDSSLYINGRQTNEISISLESIKHNITVNVVDSNGDPIDQPAIRCSYNPSGTIGNIVKSATNMAKFLEVVKSEEKAENSFMYSLPNGEHTFTISKIGYDTVKVPVLVDNKDSEVTVEMKQTKTNVFINVVDEEGNAIDSPVVKIHGEKGEYTPEMSLSGVYSCELPAGDYKLSVSKDGYVSEDNAEIAQQDITVGLLGGYVNVTVTLKFIRTVTPILSLGSNSTSSIITADGNLYVWGNNEGRSYDLLGGVEVTESVAVQDQYGGYITYSSNPIKLLSNVASISMGNYHSVLITNNKELYAFGCNSLGRLGAGTTTRINGLYKVPLENVISACTGNAHSAAITEDGSLYMWGRNNYGQLGNGTTTNSKVPIKIELPLETTSTLLQSDALSAETSPILTESGSNTYHPDTLYNLYVLREASSALDANNIYYMNQYKADKNGTIEISYNLNGLAEDKDYFLIPYGHIPENKNVIDESDSTDLSTENYQYTMCVGDMIYFDTEKNDLAFTTDDSSLISLSEDGVCTAISEGKTNLKVVQNGLKVYNIEITVENAIIVGDVDEDGEVQISDATMALTIYARGAACLDTSEYTDRQKKAADVNKNGKIDISDATAILTYYAQNAAGLNPTWDKIVV